MTTPTREQVIEWAKEAGLPDAIAAHPGVKHALAIAMSAGRDQGLREAAAKVRAILADCEQQDIDDPELEVIAAAIEQLRGK